MAWIIIGLLLAIATFVLIGFSSQRKVLTAAENGYFNEESGKFIATEANGSTRRPIGNDWILVTKGQEMVIHTSGFNRRPLQSVSLLFLIFVIFGFIKVVPANNVGIMFDPLAGVYETVNEGYHFEKPWVRVYNISTKQQELLVEEFSVQTTDGEYAWFIVEILYKVNRVNAFEVFQNYQGLPPANMMETYVQESVKDSVSSYNIYAVLGSKFSEAKQSSDDALRAKLDAQGIDLISLNFIDVDGGAAIEAKIVERGLAQQQQEIEEQLYQAALISQQKEQVEAETARIVRQEESDAQLYEAQKQADAAAYLIEKQADADLYQAQQEALGIIALGDAEAAAYQAVISAFGTIAAYNQYIHYTQWDGSVPQIVMGDSAVLPIWDMGDLINP
jgi:regulator of protease activity HflC (stomatin/prohibitin superfamily)